jgi:hypothetical protein
MTGAPDRSMGLLDLIPVALIWWVWKWKPDEGGSHDSKVPTPSPAIRATPPAPIPEYPHSPPAVVQQMSDSAPDPPQSSVLSCSECGHENPAEVNFCTKCRAKMTLECNKCGFKSPQGSEFCGSCGEDTEFRVEKMARNAAAEAAAAEEAAAEALRWREAEDRADIIPVERYHANGQLRAKGYQKESKWHGPYERYHENGQLQVKGTYNMDKRHGPNVRYDANGQVKEKGTFNMGQKCGEWIEEKTTGWFVGKVTTATETYDPCPPGN